MPKILRNRVRTRKSVSHLNEDKKVVYHRLRELSRKAANIYVFIVDRLESGDLDRSHVAIGRSQS
jgi:hypothetical protein